MLPAVRTDEEWQAVVWDEQVIRPAAEDLAGRLAQRPAPPEPTLDSLALTWFGTA
jgi:hygromycin-B 7''-O-kinase